MFEVMPEVKLKDNTVKRTERYRNLLNYVVPCIEESDRETCILMIAAHMNCEYVDALEDVIEILDKSYARMPPNHNAKVLIDAIKMLKDMTTKRRLRTSLD